MDVIKTDKCEHTVHQTFTMGKFPITYFSPDVYPGAELNPAGKQMLVCSVCNEIVAACPEGTWINGIPVVTA